jgi:hypothetical protein
MILEKAYYKIAKVGHHENKKKTRLRITMMHNADFVRLFAYAC